MHQSCKSGLSKVCVQISFRCWEDRESIVELKTKKSFHYYDLNSTWPVFFHFIWPLVGFYLLFLCGTVIMHTVPFLWNVKNKWFLLLFFARGFTFAWLAPSPFALPNTGSWFSQQPIINMSIIPLDALVPVLFFIPRLLLRQPQQPEYAAAVFCSYCKPFDVFESIETI